ncbi:MAG: diguanylate cyclase, partial [Ruminococcus sp.]|nr:diguanylate cyclase [Ruminococcus sp.]
RGKDSSAAQKIAEKIRNKVEEYIFPDILHITCSIGVTEIKKEDDFASAFDRIDKAMYASKQNGRNQVTEL